MNDQNKIDGFALEFAKTGDGHSFTELLRLMDPILKYEARKRENHRIRYQDIYSVFQEAVWKAAIDFDGRTSFVQRYRVIMLREFIDLCRYHRAIKRVSDTLQTTDFDENTLDWNSICKDDVSTVEQTVVGNAQKKELLDGFARTNEQQGKIIKLLDFGCTFQEIASVVFGASEYDARSRKGVQRAKEKFKEYLDSVA
ncbi:hypothetical protein GTO91_02905 [Heliobacterium undosum]|uniref:Sigma-70 family RNA polymerase sigma factor n=1 Tax=Heliomicrobium undosum TaxID=121734 RepID=A0A845L4I4_9FIRM|nr:sigma-70 family RNA polymerase sigma factor [Heliomicrobium undosum]MZP28668.1 hypothetical protein [Heliomicrobium undosum]